MEFFNINWKKISVKKGTLPLRWVSSPGPFDCSDDRAFDRQSKDPGLDTQRSGSVPFFTEKKKFQFIKTCNIQLDFENPFSITFAK